MKILVLSDLHVDGWGVDVPLDPVAQLEGRRIDDQADVIVLAGDIHEGVAAPEWAREAFPDKEIVLVAGNHEFYGHLWHRDLANIRQRSHELGIHFLENDAAEIAGIRFLGCTLWSDYLLYGEQRKAENMSEALRLMTDFRRIKVDPTPDEVARWPECAGGQLLPNFTLARHEASAAWLDEQLAQGDPATTVVVSHHPPLPWSIPESFVGDKLAPAYASNLKHLVGRSKVWIHGHVHDSFDYQVGMTRVVCNPRGYPDIQREPLNPDFSPAFLVEI